MRKTKNIIKINGHTYDAITGELLRAGQPTHPKHTTTPPQIQVAGAIIKPSEATTVPKKPKAVPKAPAAIKKPVVRDKAKTAGRPPQHSRTLMRSSVRKPARAAHTHDKIHTTKAASTLAKNTSVVTVKKSARRVNEHRLHHAKSVPKSKKITKFSTPAPVRHTLPAHSAPKPKRTQPIQHHATTTHPRRASHHQPVHRPKTTEDLLQEALHHATSHKQPALKKRHHLTRSQQVAGFSALIVISGALLAFVALQSTPAIKMRIASAKAGFAASLPGNSPAGFHLGDLSYGAGAVAIDYKSNSDNDRRFSITQKSSSWDSTTLRDTFVQPADKNFRAVEDGGLTIYLYGDNNATWVDNGVWYQVQGNGSLSDRQLVDIAKSL